MTWTEEQTYFFRLSAYADKLLAHYEAHPEFIGPDVRRNEVVSFVSGGLRDLSISRTTFDWGVPVPDHPDHVMYVWVDALTNYLTGVGFPDTDSECFPAILASRSAHDRQGHHPVPHRVLARVSDVGRNRVAAQGFRARLRAQPRREDEQVGGQRRRPGRTSSTRSVSTRCATSSCARCRSGRTAATARTRSSTAINADLANELGNLAQRSLSMVAKNLDGIVPEPGEFTDDDRDDAGPRKRRAAVDGAGAFRRARDAPRARGHLADARRGQPVLLGAGAVGAAQVGPPRPISSGSAPCSTRPWRWCASPRCCRSR